MRYGLVIYWSKADSTFLVEVPGTSRLHGGWGDIRGGGANVRVIISEWLEAAESVGRPIPEPRGKLDFVES